MGTVPVSDQRGECTRQATRCCVVPHKVPSKAVLTLGWGGTNQTITKQLLLYESTDLSESKHYVLSSSETRFSRVSVISRGTSDLFMILCYKNHWLETPSVKIGLLYRKLGWQFHNRFQGLFFFPSPALNSLTCYKVFFYGGLLLPCVFRCCQEKCLTHVCLGNVVCKHKTNSMNVCSFRSFYFIFTFFFFIFPLHRSWLPLD